MGPNDFKTILPRISSQLIINLQKALGISEAEAEVHFIPAMTLFISWLEESRAIYVRIVGKTLETLEKELLEFDHDLGDTDNPKYPSVQSMLYESVMGYKEKLKRG